MSKLTNILVILILKYSQYNNMHIYSCGTMYNYKSIHKNMHLILHKPNSNTMVTRTLICVVFCGNKSS